MSGPEFLSLALFLLVVINPVSKMALIAAVSESHTRTELRRLSLEACMVGFGLLVAFAFAGKMILRDVFHVSLYSVEFAGGTAIFVIGLRALREGKFFTFSTEAALRQISAAPIGMPMIAGPAAIAAVISAAVVQSPWAVSLAAVPGMAVNLAVMLVAGRFGSRVRETRFLGPLVRITGLFMGAIGAEMALRGLGTWLNASLPVR